jgi:hypothetical protein
VRKDAIVPTNLKPTVGLHRVSHYFNAVFHAILSSHSADLSDAVAALLVSRPIVSCIGVSYIAALSVISASTPLEREMRLLTLLDGGLLYHNVAKSSIELLVPIDALMLPMDLSAQSYLLWVAVQMMYNGICDENSPSGVADVNAGTALERLVRPRIGWLMQTHCTRSNIVIRIGASGALEWRSDSMSAFEVVSDIRQISGVLLTWTSETGLDGVLLDPATFGTTYYLHGWQNKGGRGNISFGGGNLSTALTGSSGLLTIGNVGRVDDSRINGVVVKATAGFCKLVNALCIALPAVVVLPASILVTTTKNGALARAELRAWHDRFYIPDKVWKLMAPNVTAASRKQLVASPIAVTLRDGPLWTSECVDPAITDLLGQLLPMPAPLGGPDSSSSSCSVM